MGCCQDDDDEVSWGELGLYFVTLIVAIFAVIGLWDVIQWIN